MQMHGGQKYKIEIETKSELSAALHELVRVVFKTSNLKMLDASLV